MTANINQMAYIQGSATPWHGLGNVVELGASIEEWIGKAGANWELWGATVAYRARNPQDPTSKEASRVMTFPERRVLYRSDNGEPISVMSNRYKVVQPAQVIEFFRDLCDSSGWSLETAGVLGKGETFWALAKVGKTANLGTNRQPDEIGMYMLVTTTADGTGATKVRGTSVRVVCENTLTVALNSTTGLSASVPHSTTFDAHAIKSQLGLIDMEKSWSDFRDEMQKLQDVPINPRQAEIVFSELLRPSGLELDVLTDTSEDEMLRILQGPVGSRKIRGLESLKASYTNAPGAQPGNAYGVLQAVTHHIDHSKESPARVKSALVGAGERTKQRALTVLDSFAQAA